MLSIAVSEARSFHVGAPLSRCEAHFSDFARMLEDLPDIRLVETLAPGLHRVAYSAAIAEVYQIDLFSDVRASYDRSAHVLTVMPHEAPAKVPAKATLASLTGHGRYQSRLALSARSEGTDIRYEVRIDADLPTPVSLRLLPSRVARRAVQAIVTARLRNVVDRFVDRVRARLAGAARGLE